MRSVAERLVVGLLAAADVEGAGVIDDEAQGLDAGAVVRAVAEGLLLGASAAALEVRLSFRQLDLVGARLRDDRLFRHARSPLSAVPCAAPFRNSR